MNCDRCGRRQRARHELPGPPPELVCCACFGCPEAGANTWWRTGMCAEARDLEYLIQDLDLTFLPVSPPEEAD